MRECQAVRRHLEPAVAPHIKLLVHGQVAGGRGVRVTLCPCAAIRNVDGTVPEWAALVPAAAAGAIEYNANTVLSWGWAAAYMFSTAHSRS